MILPPTNNQFNYKFFSHSKLENVFFFLFSQSEKNSVQVTCIKINWTVRPPSVLNSRESTWSYVKLNTIIIELREIYALEQGQSDTRRAQTVWDNVNAKKRFFSILVTLRSIIIAEAFDFVALLEKNKIKTWRNFIVSIPTSQLTTSKNFPYATQTHQQKHFIDQRQRVWVKCNPRFICSSSFHLWKFNWFRSTHCFVCARILCDEKNEEKEILSSLKPSRVSRKKSMNSTFIKKCI